MNSCWGIPVFNSGQMSITNWCWSESWYVSCWNWHLARARWPMASWVLVSFMLTGVALLACATFLVHYWMGGALYISRVHVKMSLVIITGKYAELVITTGQTIELGGRGYTNIFYYIIHQFFCVWLYTLGVYQIRKCFWKWSIGVFPVFGAVNTYQKWSTPNIFSAPDITINQP